MGEIEELHKQIRLMNDEINRLNEAVIQLYDENHRIIGEFLKKS